MASALHKLLWQKENIVSLAWFRILFGILMLFGVLRISYFGWIQDLYINPNFYFTFYGFEWVKPFGATGMYIVFIVMGIAALLIALGLFYRFASILFFLSFTYIELIDKTNYLNHYYFISLVAFLLIWLPANRSHSLDVKFGFVKPLKEVSAWTINILKFQLGVVYFFAGVAKSNYHWLIEAQPLFNWLKHQSDLPILGSIMGEKWIAYTFSWAGCIFDLSVPFFLAFRKTRIYAYSAVVFFHAITGAMFPIGIFPWAMIVLTTVFFSPEIHQKVLAFFQNKKAEYELNTPFRAFQWVILLYVLIQLIVPFRYLLYPGKLFWTEQGFRFSWRVMLIEKVGYCRFFIQPENSTLQKIVEPSEYLTDQQLKQMATQPDMILQFAHFLRDEYKDRVVIEGNDTIEMGTPSVFVDAKVSLFNEGSRTFINPSIDLAAQPYNLKNRSWILPYEE